VVRNFGGGSNRQGSAKLDACSGGWVEPLRLRVSLPCRPQSESQRHGLGRRRRRFPLIRSNHLYLWIRSAGMTLKV
jgi:hypothetical protein